MRLYNNYIKDCYYPFASLSMPADLAIYGNETSLIFLSVWLGLQEHGSRDASVAGSIPIGETYMKMSAMPTYVYRLWIEFYVSLYPE